MLQSCARPRCQSVEHSCSTPTANLRSRSCHRFGDSKAVFSLIRRRLVDKYPEFANLIPNNKTATKDKTFPARFPRKQQENQHKPYSCLCPLTVLMQLICRSLSRLNINPPNGGWGTIQPLQRLLVEMQHRLRSADPGKRTDIFIGLGTVLRFHERHGRFLTTATAPHYTRLTGLRNYAIYVRDRYILSMRSRFPPKVLQQVTAIKQFSKDVKIGFQAIRRWGERRDPVVPGVAPQRPVSGTNGTFGTPGSNRICSLSDGSPSVCHQQTSVRAYERKRRGAER